MANVKVVFGKQLRKIRLAKKVSQEELAARADLHRTYVSSVERGERNISLINISRIAKALGVKIRDLFP